MAKILFLSSDPNILKPNAGGSERASALLESLLAYDVTVLTFSWSGEAKDFVADKGFRYIEVPAEPNIAAKERRYRQRIISKSHDITMHSFERYLAKFKAKLEALLKNTDVLIVDQYAVGVFLKNLSINIPVIYNSHNFELDLAKQRYPANAPDIQVARKMEELVVSKADLIITCSDKDLVGIQNEYSPRAKMLNIQNGAWKPTTIDRGSVFDSKKFLFVGSGHPPNNTAAENVIKVAKEMPEYTFALAGDSSHVAAKYSLPNVIQLGRITDDQLHKEMQEAKAFINPMEIGSGSHLKIAKALSYEMPIINSSVGARGFDLDTVASSMIVANSTQEIIKAIKSLEDSAKYESLVSGAKESFNKYDWNLLQKEYLKAVESLIKRPSAQNKTVKKKNKVLLYSIIRNEARFMNKYYENIKKIVKELDDYEFYISIYENDSSDGTKEILIGKDWSFAKHFSFISETLKTNDYQSVKDADRVKNLSIARNKAIEVSDWLSRVDYVMMIESDFTFTVESVRKLLEFEKLEPDFDIVSAISIRANNLYDAWATRKTPKFIKNKQELDSNWRNTPYGKYYSTSNGICLYRAEPFREGARYGWVNKVTKQFDCDTVIICQDFYDRGYRNIYIMHNNPVYHEHH